MSSQANRLPTVQTDDRKLQLIQSNIANVLQPVLTNPLTYGQLFEDVTLKAGLNSINHGLGRTFRGWIIVRQRGPASFYDTQDTNTTPKLTLNLVSSANVSVDIFVF